MAQQTKLHSLAESLMNVAVGYVVSLISMQLIFPGFGLRTSLGTDLQIAAWFTVVSIVRSYVLRRWFTKRTEAAS